MTALLEVRNLTKSFGGLKVTNHVDLTLEPGARMALIGPNGAGKTTLVNLITGALAASGGSVRLMGEDVSALPEPVRAARGLIRTFQVTRLFGSMTVAENLRIGAIHRQRRSYAILRRTAVEQALDEAVARVLAQLRLTDRADTPVARLAYGEQRLVELGIALVMEPRVLLLDEPAAGVPQSESHIIMDAIDDLPEDLGVVFIEHDMDLVFRFATEIVVLVSGAVICTGTPSEIAANEEVRRVYFGEAAH
ncbi:ABC transporter ATP-binding protein [Seohaeicola zhoushanensis]|uniref:ABC transporter ATP-binding protein n=1 Tax=Seohaeicola zhoushanensis TaxID=1569283 RepID=A0A8J3H353_9RHOB|nr:ABC transporter ATP-binding protein [Seohaeicola zhoushanensis]GHF72281.1 ABC transporter ATP-binding protein [Seohaeicola zhoushanensis]